MELRHIRYFVAVAEERNFTRAAARLGIGQPPLSQQIKDLEAELGVRLFRRVPHGAELTEAGTAFLEEGRRALAAADNAVLAAQRAARGEFGLLRLGFTGSAQYHAVVPALIRDFGRRYPDVALHLEEADTFHLLEALARGGLDLAFTHSEVENTGGLAFHHVEDEPLVAVLPASHRHAGDAVVRVAALAEDRFILMTPSRIGPELQMAVTGACRNAGFDLKRGQESPQLATVISLVAAELGVSLVPRSMRRLQTAGVVFRPIEDVDTRVRLLLACRRHERSRVVQNFVALARASASDEARPAEEREAR